MNIHKTALAAKVAAQNEANRVGIEFYDRAAEALRPFVGRKICKADGTLFQKVKEALPELHSTPRVSEYYSTGHGYSLVVGVKSYHCVSKGDYSEARYADATIYLGELRDGVLTKLCDKPNHRTDYTEEEILAARADLRRVKDQLATAQSRLGNFGEYDT